MRIAVISDIHANYEALKSVVEDIKSQNVDKVVCLGDIMGKGINAHKCIEIVRDLCDVSIMGNIDERTCANPEDFKDDKLEFSRITYNKSLITQDDLEFLSKMPYSYEFYLSGNLVRMYHANPNNFFKGINHFDTNFKKKYTMFEGGKYTVTDKVADVVVFGHLHYQFMEKYYNRTLINCGSVGNSGCLISDDRFNAEPKEIVQAHYVILEGEWEGKERKELGITFRSVNYDIEKELASGLSNPEFDDYAIELRKAQYRCLEKEKKTLASFGYKFDDEN